MATHSSILAWRILWMEEPGGLLSMGPQRVGHDWSDSACMHALEKEMATRSSLLAWRIPGTGEPGGLLPMGSHRVGHDWSDLAAACALGPKSLSNGSSWAYSLRFTTGKATAVRSPCTTRDTSLQLLQLEKAWVQQQRPSTTTQKLIKKQ